MVAKKVRKSRRRSASIPRLPGVPKFYVGHPRQAHVNDWGKHTLEEAVEHARREVRESGERRVVVEIVAVLEPAEAPVKVRRV